MNELLNQIKSVVDKDIPLISNLSNIASLLFKMENVNWAGFYIKEGETLYLGPFQGDVACTTIPIGKGVFKDKRKHNCPRCEQIQRTYCVFFVIKKRNSGSCYRG